MFRFTAKWISKDISEEIPITEYLISLSDLMKSSAPSRIIVVSSEGHKRGNGLLNPVDLNDLPEPSLKGGFLIYCITKLCNMLMVKELSKQLEGTGVFHYTAQSP